MMRIANNDDLWVRRGSEPRPPTDLGISTKTIGSGQTETIEFVAPTSGTYTFICSVPGHATAGMVGDLIVE